MGIYVGNKFIVREHGDLMHDAVSVGIGTTHNLRLGHFASNSDHFGESVAVGSGRIVVGAPIGGPGSGGAAYLYDLDGNELVELSIPGHTSNPPDGSPLFGTSVAVGSGRIVVGARADNVGSNDNQGAAYLFDLDGNYIAKLTSSNGAAEDKFGWSVAVGSGRIVVGARDHNTNGNNDQGSAYIYDLDGNEVGIITASDGSAADEFGWSVAIGNNKIVVGAPRAGFSGAVYAYDLDGNNEVKISSSSGFDLFGYSVAVGNGRIVVGSPWSNVSGTSYTIDEGVAYIYDLNGNNQIKIIMVEGFEESTDRFGYSVAVGSGRIVVGAREDDVDGNNGQGSAHVFDLNGNFIQRILDINGASVDYFGHSVAVGSGKIVVGSIYDDDDGSNNGSAYVWNIGETLDDYYDDIIEHYRY